ncbi:MAG: histidinol-phosphatase [Oscillospiraceae bacterium]|nr:histidinol-phosphatase [Oscillospiraceae bacterium]
MTFSNYHTHTSFCDGKDDPEALVLEAIRLGCPELGFSGHSHVPFDDYTMSVEGTEAYIREIGRLQAKYAGQIRILLGIEQDSFSPMPTDPYAYVIGSVHYVLRDGEYLSIDETRERQMRAVEEHYGGDYYAFVEDYYTEVARVYEKTRCDIVGHFDLVTKFNEAGDLFDTAHPRYRKAALAALDVLAKAPVIFEINTGAISRGYRRTPYPEPFLLEEMQKRGLPLILSSDCHNKRDLLLCFDELSRQELRGLLERLPIRKE